jgi:hypothetical protein
MMLIRTAMQKYLRDGLTFKDPGSLHTQVVDLHAKAQTARRQAEAQPQREDPQAAIMRRLREQEGEYATA